MKCYDRVSSAELGQLFSYFCHFHLHNVDDILAYRNILRERRFKVEDTLSTLFVLNLTEYIHFSFTEKTAVAYVTAKTSRLRFYEFGIGSIQVDESPVTMKTESIVVSIIFRHLFEKKRLLCLLPHPPEDLRIDPQCQDPVSYQVPLV